MAIWPKGKYVFYVLATLYLLLVAFAAFAPASWMLPYSPEAEVGA